MHEDIKKYADIGDTRELKYRFNNSLDIDPTFEKYRDDFEYCKDKNAFEKHRELTKFESNSSNFDDNYWAKLKKDLFENFSQERLEHMIEVAKVIYKDKIERLERERQRQKEEIKYTKVTSELTEEEKAIEQQKIERLRQKQIEEAQKKQLIKENKSNNESKNETVENKEKPDSQSIKTSNNTGYIADQKIQQPKTQFSEPKKANKSQTNGSQNTKANTKIESLSKKDESGKKILEETSVQKVSNTINTAEEQQEIKRLRQEQVEGAKEKLNKENESTKIIINNDEKNKKTLEQLMQNNHEIAKDPDNIIHDVALTGAAAFGVAVGVTYGATKTFANGIQKITDKYI